VDDLYSSLPLLLKPNTHRRRDKSHETVVSRRVGGVYMNFATNSRRLPTDSAMWTQLMAVTKFTILQLML